MDPIEKAGTVSRISTKIKADLWLKNCLPTKKQDSIINTENMIDPSLRVSTLLPPSNVAALIVNATPGGCS
jgi:hypothetical protein